MNTTNRPWTISKIPIQADLTIQLGSHIYVREIKVVDSDTAHDQATNPALAQIKKRIYR
jgi:hypothetical protein